MTACPNCGHHKLFLRPYTCEGCRRVGCEQCLGVYAYTYPIPGGEPVPHRVCSWACFDRLAKANLGRGLTLAQAGGSWYFGSYQLRPEAAQRALKIQAETFILAERHEDAARLYESIGMWKEAGETRRLKQRQVVTQVHVDVNDLIAQLRALGLTATYTCPACHSPIEITAQTRPDALARCAYCGAVILPTDLIQAVTKVVRGR